VKVVPERPDGGVHRLCTGNGHRRERARAGVAYAHPLLHALAGPGSHGYMVVTAAGRRQPINRKSWEDWCMPMRTDCKNYESRTYPGGETVRKCNLDLAPEAPWRCPDNCPGYAPRLADVNWAHGRLVSPPTPPEPPGLDKGAAQLLDEAEDIVNAVGPEIMAELAAERDKGPWWRRLGRRR
jgi:hypothetical protein